MRNLLLILIACTCVLTMPSCKKKLASIQYNLDSFRALNPHELFKRIDVVLLDSVPDHPITYIEKTVYHDSLFYIQDNKRANLLVYSKTGEFVRSIGNKGRGPGELDDIRDFEINRFTGNIEILGNPSPSIMIYDTKGNFIKKRNIGNIVLTIDKFYHINPDLTAWLSLGEDYKISVYSEKLNKIVHDYSLGMDRAFMGFFHYQKPFSHYGDTTFFFDTYANILFKFNVENLKFEVHKKFDFGKHNFNKSLLPHPKEWKALNVTQKIEYSKRITEWPLSIDKYIETENYSFLNKWTHNIITRKADSSVIHFNSFNDSIVYAIRDINNKFAFYDIPLVHFDMALNESMVGKDVYQKLKKLKLEDKNEERYVIIKYWLK